jgi:hypothetical protein
MLVIDDQSQVAFLSGPSMSHPTIQKQREIPRRDTPARVNRHQSSTLV